MKRLILLSLVILLSCNVTAKTLKVSYYANCFNGRLTASGERFNHLKRTAASNHYLFGTILQLSYAGKTTKVCVNDTGGFAKYGRDLDVSKAVAKILSFEKKGVVKLSSIVVYKPKKKMSCRETWRYV